MQESNEPRIVEYESSHREAFRDFNLPWIEEYFEVEEIDRPPYLFNPEEKMLDK